MKPKNQNLTIAIIAKNAEETIQKTLDSVKDFGTILLIDNHSTDQTLTIAKKHTDHIIQLDSQHFDALRNLALKHTSTDWILYLDADETITPALKHNINTTINQEDSGAYTFTRQNYFLETKMYPDNVTRLFHTDSIKAWQGAVHESPIITGDTSHIGGHLIHHTHHDITSMLEKTNQWSDIEAKLRLQADHPPVAWWRLARIALTVAWEQFVNKKVWRYGRAGIFEGYFQIVDKLIVYTKLWENQQQIASKAHEASN